MIIYNRLAGSNTSIKIIALNNVFNTMFVGLIMQLNITFSFSMNIFIVLIKF